MQYRQRSNHISPLLESKELTADKFLLFFMALPSAEEEKLQKIMPPQTNKPAMANKMVPLTGIANRTTVLDQPTKNPFPKDPCP